MRILLALLTFVLVASWANAADDTRGHVNIIDKAARSGGAGDLDKVVFGLGAVDPVVRAAAITGLGQMWPMGAEHLEAVRYSLGDMDAPVKQAALRYAGKVNDDTAIPAAIRALGDIESATKEAAHMTLVALARTDKGTDQVAWQAWAEARDKVIQPLLARTDAAVAKGDAQEICQSIHALLFLRDRPATVGQVLLKLADHPNPDVRQLVLGSLGLVEQPEVMAALARDRDLLDRVMAAPIPQILSPGAPGNTATAVTTATSAPSGPSAIFIFIILAILTAATIYAWPKRKPAPVGAAAPPAKKSKITFTH